MSASNVKSLVQSWETVRFELLNRRISDLNLKIEGSPAERFVQRLRRELETKKFIFKPSFYLTDAWGCPDRTPVIGVPFYLADERLTRLEEEQNGEMEDPKTIMMLFHHEAGHAINYAFKIPAFGTDLQFFVQPAVTNVLDEDGVEIVNQTVYTGNDSGRGLTRFNPFTETPVECQGGYNANRVWVCQGSGHWMKGPDFGKPTAVGSYQTPRTFTLSLGVRF